jgi:hypothetical protein
MDNRFDSGLICPTTGSNEAVQSSMDKTGVNLRCMTFHFKWNKGVVYMKTPFNNKNQYFENSLFNQFM